MKYHYLKGAKKDNLDIILEVVAVIGFVVLILTMLFPYTILTKIIGG